MDSVKISQDEAEKLLSMLKRSLVSEIAFPVAGERTEFGVAGDSAKDVFVVNIYRGKINRFKYSISARISKNGIILLELDIGDTLIHINPDGTKLKGSHWHIYTEEHDRRKAFPAEDIKSEDFVENTIGFLKRFNVIKEPTINYQFEMS